jgi:hypothetical protein
MIYFFTFIAFLICMYVFYRFYYKPRAEIKKYKHILQKLGYKVYEQEFAFFGISFMNENI